MKTKVEHQIMDIALYRKVLKSIERGFDVQELKSITTGTKLEYLNDRDLEFYCSMMLEKTINDAVKEWGAYCS